MYKDINIRHLANQLILARFRVRVRHPVDNHPQHPRQVCPPQHRPQQEYINKHIFNDYLLGSEHLCNQTVLSLRLLTNFLTKILTVNPAASLDF